MADEPMTMDALRKLAREVVGDEFGDIYEDRYAEDHLHEIADSCTPVYAGDILDAFRSDPTLWNDEPDIDTGGVMDTIMAVIYEDLRRVAYEEFHRLSEEEDERREELEAEED